MTRKLVQIKMTESFKDEVKRVCGSDNKTMTGYIVELILCDFRKRGLRNEINKNDATEDD